MKERVTTGLQCRDRRVEVRAKRLKGALKLSEGVLKLKEGARRIEPVKAIFPALSADPLYT